MKRIVLPLLLLAALAGGAYYYYRLENGTKETALVLSGNVDIREVNLAFRVAGRVREVKVEEGDRVKPGDELALIDPEPLKAALAEAEASLAAATAAEALLKAGSRVEDIARLKAQADALKIVADNARTTFERQRDLLASNTSSQQMFDDSRAARDRANAEYEAAMQAYLAARNGARAEELEQAAAQRRAAEAQRASVALQLADTVLYTPDEGTVLTRIVEPGTMVSAGAPAVTLSLDKPVRVRAYVREPDLGRVAMGTKVLVSTDSRPDKPYTGTVGFISPRAEFTPKQVETQDLRTSLVYRLRITLDEADELLRQGMPVTVRLASETR